MRAFSRSLPILLVGALLWLSAGTVQSGALSDTTQSGITARLHKTEGKRGTAGCAIIDLDTGDVVYSRNADQALSPASNLSPISPAFCTRPSSRITSTVALTVAIASGAAENVDVCR